MANFDIVSYVKNNSIIQGSPNTTTGKQKQDGKIEEFQNYSERSRRDINYHYLNGASVPSIVKGSTSGVVGSGINIQCRTDDDEINKQFEDLLKEHSEIENFEVTQRFHRNGAQRAKQTFTDLHGGLLIRHRYDRRWNIPYKQELIGVDMIDTSKNMFLGNKSTEVMNGLVKNRYGAVTGIYIYNTYRKEYGKSTLISTKDMTFYNPVWASLSQYSAVSQIVSILPMLDEILQYTSAEVQAAAERAKSGVYWHTSLYDTVISALDEAFKKEKQAGKNFTEKTQSAFDTMKALSERGIKPYGATPTPKDDTITQLDNKTDSQYKTLSSESQKQMSSAMGASSVSTFKDIEKGNYSSIKTAMSHDEEQYKIDFDYMKEADIIPYCKRLFIIGVQTGRIKVDRKKFFDNPREFYKFDILRQSKKIIDEAKDATANAKKLESGQVQLNQIYAEKGLDYETEMIKQAKIDIRLEQRVQELRKQAGLPIEKEEDEQD